MAASVVAQRSFSYAMASLELVHLMVAFSSSVAAVAPVKVDGANMVTVARGFGQFVVSATLDSDGVGSLFVAPSDILLF